MLVQILGIAWNQVEHCSSDPVQWQDYSDHQRSFNQDSVSAGGLWENPYAYQDLQHTAMDSHYPTSSEASSSEESYPTTGYSMYTQATQGKCIFMALCNRYIHRYVFKLVRNSTVIIWSVLV